VSIEISVTVIDRQGRAKPLEGLRPVHIVARQLAVTYKGRLYPVSPDGKIDLTKHGPFPVDVKRRWAKPGELGPLAVQSASPRQRKGANLQAAVIEAPVLKLDSSALPRGSTMELDASQRRVIDAEVSTKTLVVAGPGTGKTQVAALRISQLIRSGVKPGQILVLSFSRSAVRTLTSRIEKVAGERPEVVEELRHVAIRTFDSWAFRLLRLAGENPHKLLGRTHDQNIAAVVALLESPKRQEIMGILGKRRHVIVDEFQDLPRIRGRLVFALLGLLAPPKLKGVGFTVLGDPAQAIYGFASRSDPRTDSEVDYWEAIKELYANELDLVALTKNHRATSGIAEFSKELRTILEGDHSGEEKLDCIRRAIAGLPVSEGRLDETWNRGQEGTTAILARTNGEAIRIVQKLFGSETIGATRTVSLKAGSQTAPAWIAALLSKAKTASILKSQLLEIHRFAKKDLGSQICDAVDLPEADVTWSRLTIAAGGSPEGQSIDLSELRRRLEWPDSFPDDQLENAADHITVTTVHQSKGMEFDTVALLDHREKYGKANDALPAEEARVGFVGVTRAARALVRIPASDIYPPPTYRSFSDGSQRLCYSSKEWVNLEMGLAGDLDPLGFVDPHVHGSSEAVAALQSDLLKSIQTLRGHKVMLVKAPSQKSGYFIYNIHLQEDKSPGRLLGCTSQALTRHLLDIVWSPGYALPSTIMNLRIADIVTLTVSGLNGVKLNEPYATSRFWLGISLFGTGDFRLWKRAEGERQ
jgi:hypothetical protein